MTLGTFMYWSWGRTKFSWIDQWSSLTQVTRRNRSVGLGCDAQLDESLTKIIQQRIEMSNTYCGPLTMISTKVVLNNWINSTAGFHLFQSFTSNRVFSKMKSREDLFILFGIRTMWWIMIQVNELLENLCSLFAHSWNVVDCSGHWTCMCANSSVYVLVSPFFSIYSRLTFFSVRYLENLLKDEVGNLFEHL